MTIEYVAAPPGEYVSLSEEAAGKGLKSILGFALSLVIPVAAPWLAGVLRISQGLGSLFGAAAGRVLGGAAVGAVMGGVSSRLQGGKFGEGALGGAIGGGLGGLRPPGSFSGSGADSMAGSTAGDVLGAQGGLPGLPGSAPRTWSGAQIPTSSTSAPMALGDTVKRALSSAGQQFANAAQNPQFAAAITQAALGLIHPPPNLEAAVAARRAELQALQAQDMAAYQRVQSVAQEMMNSANQSDPFRAGLQAATTERIATNRAAQEELRTQAGNRSYSGGRRQADARRASLAGTRGAMEAFNEAYGQAGRTQAGLRTQAAGLMGTTAPRGAGDAAYDTWVDQYAANEERRRREGQLAGLAYSAFTNPKYQGPAFTGG